MAKKILIADDSLSVRTLLRLTLGEAGYEIIEAEDGSDAFAKLDGNTLHLLIFDINMPGIDGIELVRKTRTLPSYRFIPIILLTTESQPEKRKEGKAAGATGWITKPFTSEQLLAIIKKLIG